MDIPEDVLRIAESVFEQHDGGDTVGYMAAAILADRKEQGDWKARIAHIDGIYRGAIDNLQHHQRQLDQDGIEVAVSRQALWDVLAGVEAALAA